MAGEGDGVRLARPLTAEEIEVRLQAAGIDPALWVDAVAAYSEGDYEYLKRAMLTNAAAWEHDVDWYYELRGTVTLIEAGLAALPRFDGPIYRGINLSALTDHRGGDLVPGEVVVLEALTSFSRMGGVRIAYAKRVVFEVLNNRSGVSIEAIAVDPSEAEVLVPGLVRYTILNVLDRSTLASSHPLAGRDGWYVLMEEINE